MRPTHREQTIVAIWWNRAVALHWYGLKFSFVLVLIFGGAKSLVGIGEFTLPLSLAKPPITPVVTLHSFCDGAVLAIDVHPLDRYIPI